MALRQGRPVQVAQQLVLHQGPLGFAQYAQVRLWQQPLFQAQDAGLVLALAGDEIRHIPAVILGVLFALGQGHQALQQRVLQFGEDPRGQQGQLPAQARLPPAAVGLGLLV